MFGKAATYDLFWDAAAAMAVEESQRWILTAMQRYGHELVTMLWRILGNEQDVCDAYQTTFLRLANHEGGRRPRAVKAYLFRTAGNTAVSMLRRRQTERRALSNIKEPSAESPSDPSDFDAAHLVECLRHHITQLPEHLQNVIVLRDLGELSYAEVGRTLGISAGSARVYRCKALQMLAARMNGDEDEL